MNEPWRLVPAAEARAHLPMLARWHHAQWATLYTGWTERIALEELQSHAASAGSVPTTIVAEADGHPLGSVSLVDCDSPDLSAFEGPWLASLYVVPAARGQGLGEALVRAVVAHAAAAGLPRLRLFTPAHRAFYERLGWAFEASATSAGTSVDVMRIVPGR